jgi:hypothetical protein
MRVPDRTHDDNWHGAAAARHWSEPDEDFGDEDAAYDDDWADSVMPRVPAKQHASRHPRGSRYTSHRTRRKLPAVMLAILVICCVLIGFGGMQGLLLGLDMYTAAKDAKAQATALETILRGGNFTQVDVLTAAQQHLEAMATDLSRLQRDIPAQGLIARTGTGGELLHVLRMASLLVNAGEYGIDAGQVLLPAIKSMMSGLGSSTVSTAKPLTIADLQRVQFDADSAGHLVNGAMQERALVSDHALQSVGLGSVAKILDKLDAIAPKLPTYLNDLHYAVSALPSLLGLTGSANYLLFSQDSDELRPTGGFLGNYALLQFSNGKLVSGVHFQDIYSLDCPVLGYPRGCPSNPIPAQYAWLSDDPSRFGVRDSNLDPDFPVSASYTETNFNMETQKTVNGVIAFTPAFIGKIVDVLGGIEIPAYGGIKVTSATLQDTIHYFHILYSFCQIPQYASDVRCKQAYPQGNVQSVGKKTFDSLLGSTLMKAVSTAGATVQGKVLKAVLGAIASRDLQIYFNDPQVEGLLGLFHADNTMPTVNGDQLLVMDANVGASYANADIKEQISDTIQLNADGSATHALTITYTYPWVNHLYSPIYSIASGMYMWYYLGVLLVMVPQTAQGASSSACAWPSAYYPSPSEQGRSVIGCADKPINSSYRTGGIDLRCHTCNQDGTYDQYGQTTSYTVRFSWVVPAAIKTVGTTHTYHITLVHQAGTHPALIVTLLSPSGQALTSASSTNPPLKAQSGGLTLTLPTMTTDQDITVSYK